MDFEEFIRDREPVSEAIDEPQEIEVQKAVVESLAADKVQFEEEIKRLCKKQEQFIQENRELAEKIKSLEEELKKAAETLAKNSEGKESTKVALIERSFEINDRFIGETRDHVLEAITEARNRAEEEGRNRKAQVLESVLVENEPNGELVARRRAIEKLFSENQYILNGTVINELDKLGIKYKEGEKTLLAEEIIKKNY